MAKKFTWDDVQIIVLQNKKYVYGSYSKGSMNSESEFTSLKSAQEKLPTNFIKPSQWLTTRGLDSSLDQDLFSTLKSKEIYILSPPIEPGAKMWDFHWFTHVAEKCNNCIKKCKESGFVTIQSCKDFKAIGAK